MRPWLNRKRFLGLSVWKICSMAYNSGARYPGRERMKKRKKETVSNDFIQNFFNG